MDSTRVSSDSRSRVVPQGDAPLPESLALAQFNALRAELVSLRESMIKLALYSVAGFPTLLTLIGSWSESGKQGDAAAGFGLLLVPALPSGQETATEMLTALDPTLVTLWASPIMVSLCALLFCSLHCGVMRIGGFIRDHIESAMMQNSGWESYLDQPGRRVPEKCFLFVMIVLYIVYFFGASILAETSAPQQIRLWLGVGYTLVFIFSVIVCFACFRFRAKGQRFPGREAVRAAARLVSGRLVTGRPGRQDGRHRPTGGGGRRGAAVPQPG